MVEDAPRRTGFPPLAYWTLPALIALLRALPFLEALRIEPSAGYAVLPVGYNPPDWLQYLAMIRQVPDGGGFLLENPFTTEPQAGRFVLLFHWLVGVVCAVTGAEAAVVLEVSRAVLIFCFFGVLWWFLEPFLASRAERLWAAALVGLGGGLDVWLRPLAGSLPAVFGESLVNTTWQAYGWSTFGAMYNPLWIAALGVMLLLLRPILLRPDGELETPIDFQGARRGLYLGLGLALLWWIHPYSAVAVVAIAAGHWVVGALTTRTWAGRGALVSVVSVFALVTGPVIFWQRMDPVYSAASSGFFGSLALSVFWYPLTYGALLALAVVGFRNRLHAGGEPRIVLTALGSWILTVAILHSSPIWNGYHYVMYQHIPLSILAATGLGSLVRPLRGGWLRAAGAVALLALTFGTPVLVTLEAVQAVRTRDQIAETTFELLEELSGRPAGNVLAPADLGNLIPAYTHHRVFVGHWFLTPDYEQRSRLYDRLVSDPEASCELSLLLEEQEIDYLVAPSNSVALVMELGSKIRERKTFGSLDVLILGESADASRPMASGSRPDGARLSSSC